MRPVEELGEEIEAVRAVLGAAAGGIRVLVAAPKYLQAMEVTAVTRIAT